MKKSVIVFFILLLFAGTLVNAQLIKSTRSEYFSSDSLFVSTITVNSPDKLCRASSEAEVKLFIIENKETWNGGESLDDVRGNPSGVPNGKFTSKKVWEGMKLGSFDLVVDCNDNGDFDFGEPLFNEGFSVIAKKANAVIEEGSIKIPDYSWQYDSEGIDLLNEIVSLNAFVENEDVVVKNITVKFSGSSSLSLEAVEFHVDKNSNGIIDDGDTKIGEIIVEESIRNNDVKVVPVEHTIGAGLFETLILVYKMKDNSEVGSYNVNIMSVTGQGTLSQKVITFSGLPLASNKLTVLSPKTCLGSMQFSFKLSPVEPRIETVGIVSGLEGCDSKKVSVKSQFCSVPGGELKSCLLQNGACEISISSDVSKTFFACLDKNDDKDYDDFGESVSNDLEVIAQEIEMPLTSQTDDKKNDENNKSESTAEITETTLSPITGNVVNENAQSVAELFGSQTMVVFEVTLLLILFVLVLIFFKLRAPQAVIKSMESSEDFEKKNSEKKIK